MPRGVWGMELLVNVKWAKKPQQLLLSVVNTALGFGSYVPLRHSWGPWGSWWRWSRLSNVSSHCERLLLQKREFKELIAISISCPSQFLDFTEDISAGNAAHSGWGEAEENEHATSPRWQMLHEKVMVCVPEQQSRLELCKQHLFKSEEGNWWGRALPAGKCGVCLMWQWSDPGNKGAAGSCPKATPQQLVAGLAVAHCGWW